MFVGVITVELRIPMAQSLKDKRSVIRSLTDKCKNKFNVAVSEVDNRDLWKNATLGIATVTGDQKHLEKMIDKIIKFIEDFPGVFLYNFTVDYY